MGKEILTHGQAVTLSYMIDLDKPIMQSNVDQWYFPEMGSSQPPNLTVTGKSLLWRGFITKTSTDDRLHTSLHVTDAGRNALVKYREKLAQP